MPHENPKSYIEAIQELPLHEGFCVVCLEDGASSIVPSTAAAADLATGIVDLITQFRERNDDWFMEDEIKQVIAESLHTAKRRLS